MIGQVGANARVLSHDSDVVLVQVIGRAHAGQHEQLRAADGPGGHDDLRLGPGDFLDARNPQCGVRNEQLWLDLQETESGRYLRVKQIAGALARRIVCWLKPGEEVRVARAAAFVVGAVAIVIAIVLGPTANVAFLVALAFAVAASANLPVIVLSIFWRRFNTAGAVSGLGVGLLASIGLILVSPSIMGVDTAATAAAARHLIQHAPLFPLENPGILSIPLGFVGAIVGTLLSAEPTSQEKFNELLVRSNTGLGAEKATAH